MGEGEEGEIPDGGEGFHYRLVSHSQTGMNHSGLESRDTGPERDERVLCREKVAQSFRDPSRQN